MYINKRILGQYSLSRPNTSQIRQISMTSNSVNINDVNKIAINQDSSYWRWCWVNFQYRGDLLIWIIDRQGPTVLAIGAGGGCLDIFSPLSPSLWETARYRLKYSLKGPLSPKQLTNWLSYRSSDCNIGHRPSASDQYSRHQRKVRNEYQTNFTLLHRT